MKKVNIGLLLLMLTLFFSAHVFGATTRTDTNPPATTKVGNPPTNTGGWPVSSASHITQGINGIYDHYALYAQGLQSIDVSNVIGTPIYTTFDGKVQAVCNDAQTSCGTFIGCNYNGCGYGRHVVVTSTIDGKSVSVFFGHFSEISVTQGQEVKKGDVLGKMGTTGYSTGPHLHWEFRGIPMAIPHVPTDITPLNCDDTGTPCKPASIPAQ